MNSIKKFQAISEGLEINKSKSMVRMALDLPTLKNPTATLRKFDFILGDKFTAPFFGNIYRIVNNYGEVSYICQIDTDAKVNPDKWVRVTFFKLGRKSDAEKYQPVVEKILKSIKLLKQYWVDNTNAFDEDELLEDTTPKTFVEKQLPLYFLRDIIAVNEKKNPFVVCLFIKGRYMIEVATTLDGRPYSIAYTVLQN